MNLSSGIPLDLRGGVMRASSSPVIIHESEAIAYLIWHIFNLRKLGKAYGL